MHVKHKTTSSHFCITNLFLNLFKSRSLWNSNSMSYQSHLNIDFKPLLKLLLYKTNKGVEQQAAKVNHRKAETRGKTNKTGIARQGQIGEGNRRSGWARHDSRCLFLHWICASQRHSHEAPTHQWCFVFTELCWLFGIQKHCTGLDDRHSEHTLHEGGTSWTKGIQIFFQTNSSWIPFSDTLFKLHTLKHKPRAECKGQTLEVYSIVLPTCQFHIPSSENLNIQLKI